MTRRQHSGPRAQGAEAGTFYVDAVSGAGSDDAAGSLAAPWATVAHAAAIYPSGSASIMLRKPDLTWAACPPYLHLKAVYVGVQGADSAKVYDIANGHHATLHGGAWAINPAVTLNFNGSSDWASIPPLVGNSDFIVFAVASNIDGGGLVWAETNSGDAGQTLLALPLQSNADGHLRDATHSFDPKVPAYGSDTTAVAHAFYLARNGAASAVLGMQDLILTSTVSPLTGLNVSTNLAAIGARDKGVSRDFFCGCHLSALVIYDSYPDATTFSARYSGVRELLYSQNILLPIQLSDAALTAGPTWVRHGFVLGGPDSVAAIVNAEEPTLLYEGNPQLLIGQTNVFKMWYSGDITTNVYYAESVDGITGWVSTASPVLLNHARSAMIKVGSVYYLYARNLGTLSPDVYTSANGVDFTLLAANIVPRGGAGTWDSAAIENISVLKDGATWLMLYDATGSVPSAPTYSIGGATSSDGIVWTKMPHNPVTGFDPESGGGPCLAKVGGVYWAWVHSITTANIFRLRAQSFDQMFQRYPRAPVFSSAGGGAIGEALQVADPWVIEVGEKVYLFYTAVDIASDAVAGIKVAVSDMPLSHLVTTSEGMTSNSP